MQTTILVFLSNVWESILPGGYGFQRLSCGEVRSACALGRVEFNAQQEGDTELLQAARNFFTQGQKPALLRTLAFAVPHLRCVRGLLRFWCDDLLFRNASIGSFRDALPYPS